MTIQKKRLRIQITLIALFLSLAGAVAAPSDSVVLYTPCVKVSVSPGQTVEYTIDLINNSKEIISPEIYIRGLPSSWSHSLKALLFDIRQLSVLPGEKKSMTLSIQIPFRVNKGTYKFKVYAGDLVQLPLSVVVSEQGTFKTEFTTKQANMQGNTTATFIFEGTLKNTMSEKELYAFTADVPPGWNVIFRYNGRQLTSVELDPYSTATISIEMDPPDMIAAGTYEIPVHATTSTTSAVLNLEVVITGSFAMELTTPTGLLSTSITAGDQKLIPLIIKNTGSAQLKGIMMSATSPLNWEVTFDPKKIDELGPGQTAPVNALIKASKKAIAGDYVTSLDAKTIEISSKAQIRVSVKTSMLWGWVGILIILAALYSVYHLFRRYGRR